MTHSNIAARLSVRTEESQELPKMKPDKNVKLADLMYGHEGRFICTLSGRFDPEKYSHAPPIQLCEMKCGCWVVADGNNRVGLILRKNPEATLADIPNNLLATAQFGEWDDNLMDWWNPCAKSFGVVMRKRDNHMPIPRGAIYGVIEKLEDGKFFCEYNEREKRVTYLCCWTDSEGSRETLGAKTQKVAKA
jgi:hypothetical protein